MLKGYLFTIISIYNELEIFNQKCQRNLYYDTQRQRLLTLQYVNLWHTALISLSKYEYSILVTVMKAIDTERKSKTYESK